MSAESYDKLGIATFVRYTVAGVWEWGTDLLRKMSLEMEFL
jgi:hypothetical protein